MVANHVAPVLAIQLLFLAYLICPANELANRATLRLAIESLFFAGAMAESLTHLAQTLVGPPVTSWHRILRATVGIVYPLNFNLIFILRFLEILLEEARDAGDTSLRAIRSVNITSLSVLSVLFGLMLANSIAGVVNEQLRRPDYSVRELLDLIVFLLIGFWSFVALRGIYAAIRPNIPGAALSESELLDVMDWTLFHRETVVWLYYARNTLMEVIAHDQAFQVPVDLRLEIMVSSIPYPCFPGSHSLAASHCVHLHTFDAGNAF